MPALGRYSALVSEPSVAGRQSRSKGTGQGRPVRGARLGLDPAPQRAARPDSDGWPERRRRAMVLVSPEQTRYIGATDSLRKRLSRGLGHLVGWGFQSGGQA